MALTKKRKKSAATVKSGLRPLGTGGTRGERKREKFPKKVNKEELREE